MMTEKEMDFEDARKELITTETAELETLFRHNKLDIEPVLAEWVACYIGWIGSTSTKESLKESAARSIELNVALIEVLHNQYDYVPLKRIVGKALIAKATEIADEKIRKFKEERMTD